MRSKTIMMASILAVCVASMAATAYSLDDSESNDVSVPRYSETCAHGHNGFDCKPPSYAKAIDSLEQRVSQLEQDVQNLGRR